MSVRLFDASRADLAALSRLHAQAFDPAWSPHALSELLNAGAFGLAAGAEKLPDGLIIVRVAADEAEILTLVVAEQRRRSGVARALVRAAASEAERRSARAMFLEVDVANAAARSLYDQLGFVPVGQRPRYYRKGAQNLDALTLRADLPLTAMGKAVGN